MDDEQIRRLAATLRNMGWLVPVGAIQSALHAEKLCLVEADAEISRLNAEIARMREDDASNKRALEAWLSGVPSRPPVTGRRKTLAGTPA
jgi:hypothetical protein